MMKLPEYLNNLEMYERFLSFYAVKVLRALRDAFPQAEHDLVAFLKGQSFNVPLEMFRAYIEKNPEMTNPADKIGNALYDRHGVLLDLVKHLGEIIGRDVAHRPLLEMMEKGETSEQGFALVTLACLGHRPAREALPERLSAFGKRFRWGLLNLLEKDGDMEWAPLYLNLLDDFVPEIARLAIRGLGRTGDSKVAGNILPLLKFESEMVVLETARALGLLKNANSVAPLIKLAKGTHSDRVRATAVAALGEFAENASIPFLTECLGKPDPRVRANASLALKKKFLALGKTDEGVVNRMRSLLQDTDHRVRADVTQCLWELGRIESLDQIKTMMSDRKSEARASAAYLCGKLKLLQLKDDLIQMTLDEAWSVRKMAALALLGLSHPGKTELNRLFLKGSENQQVCAALALSLDNDQKGIEHLFTMANSESELADFATELLLSFS